MTANTTKDRDLLDSLDGAFGTRVRQARLAKRLRQQDLVDALNSAFKLGWYQQTLGRLEAGDRQVRITEAVAIATVLDVPLTELVYGTPQSLATVEAAERAYDELDAVHQRISKMIEDRKLQLRLEAIDPVVEQAQRRWSAQQNDQEG
jgi:transcriptional regulator with XRE-family HTH domain